LLASKNVSTEAEDLSPDNDQWTQHTEKT
jgi:hypothetical protein